MPELLIQRLDIKGFRGVSQKRSLLFNGRSVLLFGENGTGKSTFVDALEKLFTGEVDTLDHRAQGLSCQRHGPHIKYSTENPEIAVTLTDNTKIEVGSDPRTFSPIVQRYLETSRQPVYILRRGQILAFIESQPRDRYELLRPYLTLSDVEEAEGAFAKADEQLQADVNRLRWELAQQRDDLARQIGVTKREDEISEARVLEALNDRLIRANHKSVGSLADTSNVIQALDSELSQFGDTSKPAAISGLLDSLEELANGSADINIEVLASSMSRLREVEAQQTKVIYERVLEEGARWIEEERRKECPLCEQEMRRFTPEEVVKRAQHVLSRLMSFSRFAREFKRKRIP